MLIPKFKLTDVTESSIKVNGQKMTLDYFKEVFVTMCLNASWNDYVISYCLFEAMEAVNISPEGYGKFSQEYANRKLRQHEEAERLQREAKAHAERMADMFATPAEIKEYRDKQKAQRAAYIAKVRRGDAGF